MFVLYFFALALGVLGMISFWVILFTGKTPEWYYNFALKTNRWSMRLSARIFNLSDGYPAFGLDAVDENTQLDFPHIHIGRGQLLLRTFLGVFMLIPHIFVLYFRLIGSMLLYFLAWWVVLFTGNYPLSWHNFNVGTFRWSTRISLWSAWLIADYPPFSGRPDIEPEDQLIDQVD